MVNVSPDVDREGASANGRRNEGTAVSIYDDAALVEVSEDAPPGRALDMFVVSADQLEVTWRIADHRPRGMEA